MGRDLGWYTPLFDVQVSAQKQSPYTKLSQNELALQFFNQGFFDPKRADMALACLEMMDFPRKENIIRMITEGISPAVSSEVSPPLPRLTEDILSRAREHAAGSVLP